MLKTVREVGWLVAIMASLPLLTLGLEFAGPWRAEVPQNEPPVPKCTTPAECNARGAKALEAKRFAEADSFFDQELQMAEDGDKGSALLLALNNLAVSRIHQRDYLMARAWIGQALQADSANPAAIHNLRAVEANQRTFRWPPSPNGDYVQYVACGAWNRIRITDASPVHAKLAFSGLRTGAHPCSDFMPSTGELEGELHLRGRAALYKENMESGPCQIDIVFHGGSLSVKQDGWCDFGHGVHADGDYERVSTN
jgi:hypothetical protein